MNSPSSSAEEAPDLVCQLDNVQGMVDALTTVRWKRQQRVAHLVMHLASLNLLRPNLSSKLMFQLYLDSN
ncbi:hypothetical protein ACE6H2_015608 [Prunus campanulata]